MAARNFASSSRSSLDLDVAPALLVVVLALALAACASPQLPVPEAIVSPDVVPELAEGEGLLLVHVDTDQKIEGILANRMPLVGPLERGRYAWMIRVPAGRVAWSRIELPARPISPGEEPWCPRRRSVRIDPRNDLYGVAESEFEFEVKPGVINYAGELIVRAEYGRCGMVARAVVRNRNHSAMALRSVARTHAAIVEAFPVHSAGTKGDGFLDFFDRERKRVAERSDPAKTATSRPAPGPRSEADRDVDPSPASGIAPVLGQSADVLFPFAETDLVRVSPTGSWIVARARRGDRQGVMVQRVGVPKVELIGQYAFVRGIAWEGPDALLVESADASGWNGVELFTFRLEGETLKFESERLPGDGKLIDARPLHPGEVIWEFQRSDRSSIHRVTLDQLRESAKGLRYRDGAVLLGQRMAVVLGTTLHWILDRDGVPIAAWRLDERGYTVLVRRREGISLEPIHRYQDGDPRREMIPVGLAADGRSLLVAARRGGDFLALFELDRMTGEIGAEVFRAEAGDVTNVVSDDLTGETLGVVYSSAGEERVHYFAAYRDRFLPRLSDAWDEGSISIVSASEDRESFVFFLSSAQNPGEYHFRDPKGDVTRIASLGEEIDRRRLSPVRSVRLKSRDAVEVEAFLSVPTASTAPVPLVVMPHGGPIGVHDVREYDPVVQYLASWGFAVLQVNYRGSSGYGIAFEELGKKEWAKGIEDDIDAGVEWAMRLPEIDGGRVCIIGGSYGGFSALVSVLRHPDRYRCAVTINGVTDVPLIADSSDTADSKIAMQFFEESVGDLETERERLIEISPAYRMDEIRTPVLIVQGLEDRRVDPDHAYRLMTMLELHGKTFESMLVPDAGHSFDREDEIAVYRRVRRFLTEQLQPESGFRRDPDTARDVRTTVLPGEFNPQ